ncbi:RNA polymerase factor sigma-54, partial [Escherichia coli]|nr:RNA polymerase factor sigma-54 [Escherichia coli]
MWQLHVENVEAELIPIAECIIGNLDGDGRLTATNEEIAALGNWSVEEVERARQRVMQLDPTGCGARDAGECLLA